VNEDQLVEFFESRRGDTSQWSELPARAKVRGGGSVVFSIRFTPQELLVLRTRARQMRRTISELIRSAALQAAGRPPTVYTLTIDGRLAPVPGRAGLAVSCTCGWTGAAEAPEQPGQPFVGYVFGTEESPRSGSTGTLVSA